MCCAWFRRVRDSAHSRIGGSCSYTRRNPKYSSRRIQPRVPSRRIRRCGGERWCYSYSATGRDHPWEPWTYIQDFLCVLSISGHWWRRYKAVRLLLPIPAHVAVHRLSNWSSVRRRGLPVGWWASWTFHSWMCFEHPPAQWWNYRDSFPLFLVLVLLCTLR